MEKRKLLVMGASGFIGHSLKANGLFNLEFDIARSLRLEANKSNKIYLQNLRSGLPIGTLDAWKPDVVLNLAASWESKDKSKSKELEANLIYPSFVLKEVLNYVNEKPIYWIQVGSYFQLMYDRDKIEKNYYSATKNSFSHLLEFFSHKNFFAQELIFPHVFGPFENDERLMPYLIKNLSENNPVLLTKGQQFIPVMDVTDACKIILNICQNPEAILNYSRLVVKPSWQGKLCELVKLISEILESESPLVFNALPLRKNEFETPIDFEKYENVPYEAMNLYESIINFKKNKLM